MELKQICAVQAAYIIPYGFFTSRNIKRWCTKKDKAIIDGRSKCGYYVMAEFFQKRGYKVLKD